MVMEAATLSGPQRKCNVVPVQKSLSLPSYARVGGEGIDHRLIFAALEQKEKVRRKSKIFTREKTARQNIFCLPISTGSKCRETSLSSDTSCSSLEYQKPKPVSKTKKDDCKTKLIENDPPPNDVKIIKTSQFESSKSNSECLQKDGLNRKIINGHSEKSQIQYKSNFSPVDTLRLNVGSSDSMERSSRSSNDSLTRKERLTAIKARVEAEREKYGNSSSEEESHSSMTRYNSDGVIHRTVREVKSRSYRHDKKLRRRSQGEWAFKKADRKNNLSLCFNPEEDGIKLHLEKLDRLNFEINNLEVKTDYCPSPIFPDITKKSYFSDFPCKEHVSKFVQQRIKHIEEEEKKRRSGSDFFDKVKPPQQNSPVLPEKSNTPVEYINKIEKKSTANTSAPNIHSRSTEFARQGSPIPKTSQAPIPPPRSPKSINFVNKAFMQHTLQHQDTDKKNIFQKQVATVTSTKSSEKFDIKSAVVTRDSKNAFPFQSNPSEKQKMRDLYSARRKTCGNFDFVDEKVLSDLCSSIKTTNNANSVSNNNSQSAASLSEIKSVDSRKYHLSIEPSVEENKNKRSVNKWEESEKRREFMFNSLENKKKSNILPWSKKKISSANTDSCICYLAPVNMATSNCKNCERPLSAKNSETDNIQPTYFNSFKSKKNVFEPSRDSWKNSVQNTDTCLCFLTRNEKGCECINNKMTHDTNCLHSHILIDSNSHKFGQNGSSTTNKFSPLFLSDSYMNNSSSNQFQELDNAHKNMSAVSNIAHPVTDTTANANLESAMAELESVYLSLKFSSDNLTENNSASNLSLSDEDIKLFQMTNKDLCDNKMPYLKRNSIQETDSYFDTLNSSNIEKSHEKPMLLPSYVKPFNISKNKDSVPSDVENKNSSINDLFKDLTPHLNALSKINDTSNSSGKQLNPKIYQVDDEMNLSSSPVGFKKEFYENLQKQQGLFQKKKFKAVRSLSENISQLMNSPNSNVKPCRNFSESNSLQIKDLSTPVGNSSSNSFKQNACKIEPIHKLSPSSTEIVNRVNHPDRLRPSNQAEIRQIRVSMDSTSPQSVQSTTNACSDTSQYSRLSSVVYSPQMSPKCEGPRPFQFNSYDNSKDTIDKTIDGLEELLNSLLIDVPDNHQSSQPKKQDAAPTTSSSTVSTGEMRVLQHLDVIRLKPVSS